VNTWQSSVVGPGTVAAMSSRTSTLRNGLIIAVFAFVMLLVTSGPFVTLVFSILLGAGVVMALFGGYFAFRDRGLG
jgi:hypothetical protein